MAKRRRKRDADKPAAGGARSRRAVSETEPLVGTREEILSDLKTYRKLGEQSRRLADARTGAYARAQVARAQADRYKIGAEKVQTAMRFVDRYSEAEFTLLCKRRDPAKRPFPPTILTILLPIKDKKKRSQFEVELAKSGRSWRDMRAEYNTRFKKLKTRFGRPPRIPKSREEAIERARAASDSWLHWYTPTQESQLWPKSLGKILERIAADMQSLRAAAERALTRRQGKVS